MRTYLLFLLFMPFISYAQKSSQAATGGKIYLVPNFDTLAINKDTLVKGKTYSFTLVGIDSASILKVMFAGSQLPIRKGAGNTTLVTVKGPEWYFTHENKSEPSRMPLAVYRRGTNAICFMHYFISYSQMH